MRSRPRLAESRIGLGKAARGPKRAATTRFPERSRWPRQSAPREGPARVLGCFCPMRKSGGAYLFVGKYEKPGLHLRISVSQSGRPSVVQPVLSWHQAVLDRMLFSAMDVCRIDHKDECIQLLGVRSPIFPPQATELDRREGGASKDEGARLPTDGRYRIDIAERILHALNDRCLAGPVLLIRWTNQRIGEWLTAVSRRSECSCPNSNQIDKRRCRPWLQYSGCSGGSTCCGSCSVRSCTTARGTRQDESSPSRISHKLRVESYGNH